MHANKRDIAIAKLALMVVCLRWRYRPFSSPSPSFTFVFRSQDEFGHMVRNRMGIPCAITCIPCLRGCSTTQRRAAKALPPMKSRGKSLSSPLPVRVCGHDARVCGSAQKERDEHTCKCSFQAVGRRAVASEHC